MWAQIKRLKCFYIFKSTKCSSYPQNLDCKLSYRRALYILKLWEWFEFNNKRCFTLLEMYIKLLELHESIQANKCTDSQKSDSKLQGYLRPQTVRSELMRNDNIAICLICTSAEAKDNIFDGLIIDFKYSKDKLNWVNKSMYFFQDLYLHSWIRGIKQNDLSSLEVRI